MLVPMRYDGSRDEMVAVDQEWVDLVQKRVMELAMNRVEANKTGTDRAPGNDLIAAAYAVTVDGFISVSHRAIRNPHSPFIVWMSQAVWNNLANCATTQGQFYIPRTDTIDAPSVLRALVASMEDSDVS